MFSPAKFPLVFINFPSWLLIFCGPINRHTSLDNCEKKKIWISWRKLLDFHWQTFKRRLRWSNRYVLRTNSPWLTDCCPRNCVNAQLSLLSYGINFYWLEAIVDESIYRNLNSNIAFVRRLEVWGEHKGIFRAQWREKLKYLRMLTILHCKFHLK